MLMKIWLAIRDTSTDPLPLFSARMGRQFLDIEAEQLDIEAIQGSTGVGTVYRRAKDLQLEQQPRRCPQQLGRPNLAVECPENASYHPNQPV